MNILFFTSLKGVHGNKWLKAISQTQDVSVASFCVDPQDKISRVKYFEIQPKKKQDQFKPSDHQDAPVTISSGPKKNTKQKTLLKDAWLTYKIGLRFANKFASLIDKINPDIVHAHQTLPFGWYAYMATRRSKAQPPLIVSAWGTDILAFSEGSALNRHMNKKILRGATQITATGHFLKKTARRFLTKNNPEPRIVPFGIDLTKFTPKIKAPEHVTTFGIAKQLKPIYRIDLAIRALAIALADNPILRLEIAGDGPQRKYLKELVRELGVQDKVAFLGAISPDKMPKYMREWDVLLNPTKQEGFGVVALEAAACGTPMIATNTGGLPEVTRLGKTAILINNITPSSLARNMVWASKDPTLINKCLSAGPIFVKKNFDWNKNVQSMLSIYNEVAR